MKVTSNKDQVELSQASKSKHAGKAGKVSSKSADESAAASSPLSAGGPANVDISSEAKSMAAANAIARADDVDEAKIARLKAAIHGGSYKPDFGKVADKMLTEHLMQETS